MILNFYFGPNISAKRLAIIIYDKSPNSFKKLSVGVLIYSAIMVFWIPVVGCKAFTRIALD